MPVSLAYILVVTTVPLEGVRLTRAVNPVVFEVLISIPAGGLITKSAVKNTPDTVKLSVPDGLDSCVENGNKLVAEAVMVGTAGATVPVVAIFRVIAPRLLLLIFSVNVPVVTAVERTYMVVVATAPLEGTNVSMVVKPEPLEVLISKSVGAVTIKSLVRLSPDKV
jgi:hypothetical protein